MWVSQTYLGRVGEEAKVYLYYFWEDYSRQKKVPSRVLNRLAELGYSFREDVSAFVPMDEWRGLIQAEMEDKFREFWWTFKEQTPGVFLCQKPLSDFDPEDDEWLFFPITAQVVRSYTAATEFFTELHRVCQEIVENEPPTEEAHARRSFWSDLYESSQLKLTFMGAGIDFKPLISRYAKRT